MTHGQINVYYLISNFIMCNIASIIIRRGAREMRLGFKGDAARSAERNARHSKMRLYYINIIIILYIYILFYSHDADILFKR